MYIAYNYNTGEIISRATTISELSELTNVSRQTIGAHVSKNVGRDLYPCVYAGQMCFIDDSCTDIMTKLPNTDNNTDDEIVHAYKLSTGEYICPCTAKLLAKRLGIKTVAGVIKSIDRYGLKKHNIFLSRTIADSIQPPCSVYEIFTSDLNLVLSTMWPDSYKYWKPIHMPWELNPYKPNHYMVRLPETFDNIPKNIPRVDYTRYPENLLLDNNESI